MTDPFDALRKPVVPVAPDPEFAARLRDRLTRAVFDQGEDMAVQLTRREPAWPPSLTPYIVVSDARAALTWYTDVLGAEHRGEPHVNADGTIGHMEVALGDAVLMFAEPSDLYPDTPVSPPQSPTTFSHTLHLEVHDVDETCALARQRGAHVERPPATEPYGRAAVIVDPFGHRWLLLQRPGRATRARQGDTVRVSMATPDPTEAKEFYETVLQVPFEPSGTPGSWRTEATNPPLSMWSPRDTPPEVQLCYRIDDIQAAVTRVRRAGGQAQDPARQPWGLMSDCVDNQGRHFQLWQPVD